MINVESIHCFCNLAQTSVFKYLDPGLHEENVILYHNQNAKEKGFNSGRGRKCALHLF